MCISFIPSAKSKFTLQQTLHSRLPYSCCFVCQHIPYTLEHFLRKNRTHSLTPTKRLMIILCAHKREKNWKFSVSESASQCQWNSKMHWNCVFFLLLQCQDTRPRPIETQINFNLINLRVWIYECAHFTGGERDDVAWQSLNLPEISVRHDRDEQSRDLRVYFNNFVGIINM